MMKAYEILFFLDPAIDDENRAAVMKRLETTIVNNGGTVDSVDNWGRRKLAFQVDKLDEGDYILINFQADPDQIAELSRVCRISDAVKRYMITHRPDGE